MQCIRKCDGICFCGSRNYVPLAGSRNSPQSSGISSKKPRLFEPFFVDFVDQKIAQSVRCESSQYGAIVDSLNRCCAGRGLPRSVNWMKAGKEKKKESHTSKKAN